MKVDFDDETRTLYIKLDLECKYFVSIQRGDVIYDLDKNNNLIGVEILNVPKELKFEVGK